MPVAGKNDKDVVISVLKCALVNIVQHDEIRIVLFEFWIGVPGLDNFVGNGTDFSKLISDAGLREVRKKDTVNHLTMCG